MIFLHLFILCLCLHVDVRGQLSEQVFFIHGGGPRYPNQAVTLGSKCLSWLRPLNQLYENKIDLKNRPAIQICCKAVHQLRWGQGYYRTDFQLHW